MASVVTRIWNAYSNLGVRANIPTYQAIKHKMANRLFLLLFLCAGTLELIFQEGSWYGSMGGMFIAIFGIILSAFGRTQIARLVLALTPSLLLVVSLSEFTDHTIYAPPGRYVLLTCVILPLVIFDGREKVYLILSTVVTTSSFLFFDYANGFFENDPLEKTPEHFAKVRHIFIIMSTVGIIVIMVYLTGLTNKANKLSEKLLGQLTDANQELKTNVELIESQKADIDDSIVYASRIQKALLPNTSMLESYPIRNFILYQPREVVSGDFYWFAPLEHKLLIAAVDCTGHGVPGALMSVIGNMLLNDIVVRRGITNPMSIMNELQNGLEKQLSGSQTHGQQAISGNEVLDGMEMCLVYLDFISRQMVFSGANRPLYYYSPTMAKAPGAELKAVIGPDETGPLFLMGGAKRPIGRGLYADRSFTQTLLPLHSGDILYLTSDGYADQQGGPQRRKYGSRQLHQLLSQCAEKPITSQRAFLEHTLKEWRGTVEQMDDVLMIGVQLA